jgi:hypothetical protein
MPSVSNPQAPNTGFGFDVLGAGAETGALVATAAGSGVARGAVAGGGEPQARTAIANSDSFTWTSPSNRTVLVT